jgi:hypothetical protein
VAAERASARFRRAEDALALTRTLLAITLRSLYLVEPDDPLERDIHLQRMKLKLYRERRTMTRELAAAGADVSDTPDYDPLIASLEAHFASIEKSKEMPADASIARKLKMGIHYARVYRPGSEAAHWGLGAMLDSFVELTDPDYPMPVYLDDDQGDPERTQEILGLALATLGHFVIIAEPIMKLGIHNEVDAIASEARARLDA